MTTKEKQEFNKLFDKLTPSISKLYQIYNYLGLTKDEFINLSKQYLIENYSKNKNQKTDIEYYKKNIKRYFYIYTKLKLTDESTSKKIIENYINDKLVYQNNHKESVNEIIKLSNFLKNYNFTPNPDISLDLIKSNKKINLIVTKIVENNLNTIINKGIEKISDNEIFIEFIKSYCIVNEINYKNEEPEYENEEKILSGMDNYTVDSVKMYLKEIPKEILSQEEIIELCKKSEQGDLIARNKIIEHNLKLVVSIAKKYQGRGLDILELIQEGNLGLIKTTKKYDYRKGFHFTTYATWWIRQSIERAIIDKSRSIRLPVHIFERIKKYDMCVIELQKKTGRIPTIEEIAKEMKVTIETIEGIIITKQDTLSINSKISDEEENEMEMFIQSDDEPLEDKFSNLNLSENIKKILSECNLKEREIQILLLRNGFIDGQPKTLEETGKIYGLTRERIRQLENKALKKIRMSKNVKSLLSYTDDPIQSEKNLTTFKNFYSRNIQSTRSLHKKGGVDIAQNSISIQQQEYDEKEQIKTELERIKEYKRKNGYIIFDEILKLGYTKEETLSVIEMLGEKDKKRLYLVNGNDLENPVLTKGLNEEIYEFYDKYTIRNIKRLLINKYGKRENINESGEQKTMNNTNLEQELRITKTDKKVENEETTKVTNQEITEQEITNKEDSTTEEQPKKVTTKEEKKSKKKKGKNRRSLITKFNELGYTKEEIINVIKELSDIDKENIRKMDGNDLENPKKDPNITRKEEIRYYQTIIPKIKKTLVAKYGERKSESIEMEVSSHNDTKTKPKELSQSYNDTKTEKQENKTLITDELDNNLVEIKKQQTITKEPQETIISSTETMTSITSTTKEETKLDENIKVHPADSKKNYESKMTKEDYIKILELLKTPSFYELMIKLEPKKAIIIALRLGYIDNKYFDTKSIASFLGITEEEVRQTTIEMLNLHKQNLNNIIDDAVKFLTKNENVHKLTKI